MREHAGLIFSIAEYNRRLTELRERMGYIGLRGVDAMIITTPENLHYLTGYQTPGYYYFQALVIPLEGEPFMVTRRLEESNVPTRTWLNQYDSYLDTESPIALLARKLRENGLGDKRIGIEKHCYFFRATEQQELFTTCPEISFIDCTGLVEFGRVIKSEEELEKMRKAAIATEAAMQAGIGAVRIGADENDVAAEIHYAMIKAGGEYPAISPFVASGPRCSVGHATWEGRVIDPNEVVFLEIGGCYQRYHTGMMRTVYTGDPTPSMLEAEKLINEAVDRCMEAMKPGVTSADVDTIAREILESNSFGAVQSSRTGYSIGIAFPPDWGEGHIISLKPHDTAVLKENMVFHLIPWIQIPGVAGIGISETVVVKEDGAKTMFNFERKLFTA